MQHDVPPARDEARSQAAAYHLHTRHDRHSLQGRALDWSNQPTLFKRYQHEQDLHHFALPRPQDFPAATPRGIFQGSARLPAAQPPLLPQTLSRILHLCCGITVQARHGGQIFHYRSNASAGALYPVELYLALRPDLAAPPERTLPGGLLHYRPLEHALTQLGRPQALAGLAGSIRGGGEAQPPLAAFVLTSIFFRSAWKYLDRAYRYCLLDAGHLLENLLAALAAEGFAPSLYYDFDDVAVTALLGLDPVQEAPLCLVLLHDTGAAAELLPAAWSGDETPLPLAEPVAPEVQSHPRLIALHQAGYRLPLPGTPCPLPKWRELFPASLEFSPLPPPPEKEPEPTLAQSIGLRRSRRNFVPEPLPEAAVLELLYGLAGKFPAVIRADGCLDPLLTACALQNIAGWGPPDGLYAFSRPLLGLAPLRPANVHKAMANICLGQQWIRNAGLQLLFFADLGALEAASGPRSYRYAMLEAGRLGQRLYILATALGLGVCGIGAFFDQEGEKLAGVDGRAQLLYLVTIGAVRK